MTTKHAVWLSAMFGIACTATANATVLINTLGNSASESSNSLSGYTYAESFVTSGTGTLGDVELELSANTGSSGSIVVTLRNDNADNPSSIISTIARIDSNSIPTSKTLYDFYNLPITGLATNARYWIVVGRSGGSSPNAKTYTVPSASVTASGDVAIGYTNSAPFALGDTSFASTSSGAFGAASTTNFLSICASSSNDCDQAVTPTLNYAFNETPVPEPASIALLGAGLTAVGFARRKRPN